MFSESKTPLKVYSTLPVNILIPKTQLLHAKLCRRWYEYGIVF